MYRFMLEVWGTRRQGENRTEAELLSLSTPSYDQLSTRKDK